MEILSDLDGLALRAVLDRLRAMAPRPLPEPSEMADEPGRIAYARALGKYDIVTALEAALKRKAQEENLGPRSP